MRKIIIQYVWVEKWRWYRDAGFNFTSKYDFKYEKDTKELKVKNNENYCSNFFDDNIELTGIVGMNGSGKTSLSDLLIEIINETKIDTAFIIAFEIIQDSEQQIKVLVNKIEDLVLSHNTDIELYTNEFFKEYEFVTVLYNYALTNQFHSKSNDMFYNLTTSYLLNESDKNNGSSLKSYHNDERKMQLEFLNNYSSNLEDFGIKYFEEIDVSFDSKNYNTNKFVKDFNELIKDDESYMIPVKSEKVKDYLKKSKELPFVTDLNRFFSELFCAYDNSAKEVMKSKLAYALLEEIFAMFYYYKVDIKDDFYIVIIESLYKVSLKGENSDLLNKLKILVSELPEMIDRCNLSTPIRDSKVEKWVMLSGIQKLFMEFIMYFEDKVLNDKYVLSTFANGKFKLKINKSSENNDAVNAIDFVDKYAKVGIYYDILYFDYNMSSGEIALLSLYSRFYSLLKINRIGSYQHKNIDLKVKNILILLDEAEVLFHPEWQQKYINNLLEFFKHIFNGSSLQLLIATHSPIILSDIPKQNVLYLSCNDSDDKKAIYENQPETFGSNIFKLYNNAFFLDKGAIGAFAKSKLEDLLEEILKGNGEKEDLQKRINLIGDDFLRERFQSKFDAIYNNTQSVDDEIVRLEEKIEQLKKIRDMVNECDQKKREARKAYLSEGEPK